MPAPKKASLDETIPGANSPKDQIQSIGVIAGGGSLPLRLLEVCDDKGIEVFVIGFDGQTDPLTVKDRNHMWTRIGAAGQIIKTLKAHEIFDLVLIGSIRRPTLTELRPDLKTAEFFARISLKALGDNSLLTALREELESDGFTIHGIHEFAQDLLTGEGVLGRIKPTKEQMVDLERGIEISQTLGQLDVGQCVVVQQGIVLGVEAVEGTDQLITRCKHLKRKGKGGVLVKTCKPQQDRDFDLPTIGPNTVRLAADAGLSGIAIHAGHSIIIEPVEVARLADKHKIFVTGIRVPDFEAER